MTEVNAPFRLRADSWFSSLQHLRSVPANTSQRIELDDMASGENEMQIMPIGGGNEVGRSCCILKFMGKTVMFDCGVRPAYSGLASLPWFDVLDTNEIDLVLITHYHLDHAAGLPYLMEKTQYDCKRVFMTQPTRAIYKALLSDYVRVSRHASGEQSLYSEEDVHNSLKRIEVVDYHAEVNVDGIKFRPFYAAHVLGGAMFMVEIAGVRVLYTGDYSREEDRHLKAAEIPPYRPDVLIVESTYGTSEHEGRRMREKRFTDRVAGIVRGGGRALLPVFAMGRAQELLLILDEYWEANKELQKIPIYYASALAAKCMPVYQTYINMMNDSVRAKFEVSNPFNFKHVQNVADIKNFVDRGPCVFMASPGMLQSGFSRELFERWCPHEKNGVIITGFAVEGTLAKKLTGNSGIFTRLDGRQARIACSVDNIAFSAHADFKETRSFVADTKPTHCVLVHGEKRNMAKLRDALDTIHNKTEGSSVMRLDLHSPANLTPVKLHFKNAKTARSIGVLGDMKEQLDEGMNVSGLLLKQDFDYTLSKPKDLPHISSLKASKINQHTIVPTKKMFITIATELRATFEDVTIINDVNDAEIISLANGAVQVTQKEEGASARVSWASAYASDVLADAVAAIILSHTRKSKKTVPDLLKFGRHLLATRFGPIRNLKVAPHKVRIIVDFNKVTLDMFTGIVECTDKKTRERVRLAYKRIMACMFPIPDLYCQCCADCQ